MKRKKEYASPEASVEKVITSHLVCETLAGGGTNGTGVAEAKEQEEEEEFVEYQNLMNQDKGNSLW